MTHRSILHVDMDAFYVSVELRRRPELRGKPVVVGGTGDRGVVAAASYEARRYGVRSAMASSLARRRCPHLVFLPGDHDLYAEVSAQVHEVFRSVTPIVEPLALDEAFLDVTGSLRLFGSAVDIAHRIRADVRSTLDLVCSVGVAPNKFLAKLASVAAKPRVRGDAVVAGPGVVEVRPGEELAFLHPLPVQSLWGVGPATLEKLQRVGVSTVADLARFEVGALEALLGRANGRHLHSLSHAIDDRPVEVDRGLKSIGHEETFATDRFTPEEVRVELVRMADAVAARLRARGTGARTLTLKVRFSGFTTITRSVTVPEAVHTAHAILRAVEPLAAEVDPTPGVRLLGISATNFAAVSEQLSMESLFADPAASELGEADEAQWEAAETTIDAIREKFGRTAIGPASAVGERGLRVVRKGAQQWGPDDPGPRPSDSGRPG